MGVPIAPEKTVSPTQFIQFLGIDLDTVSMASSIPLEKVTKFSSLSDIFFNLSQLL